MRRLVGLLVLAAAQIGSSALAFEDPGPGSVGMSTLSLPSGPGSLEGLGDAGEISVFSGQYSYSLPFDLPAGQANFGPSLSLSYDGATGNGVAGLGWGFTTPHIQRSTRRGVPRYDGTDEFELVGLAGGGRLVRLDCGPYAGELRVEGNGQSVRVLVSGDIASPTSFTIITADGTSYRLDERVVNPANGKGFEWLVSEIRDADEVDSKSIFFEYTDADSDGADDSPGHALLRNISWGPELSTGPAAGQRAYRVDLTLDARPDPTESYRAGFHRILRQRLAAVVVRSFGSVRKRYDLSYDAAFPISRIASIATTGADFDPVSDPLLSFEYGSEGEPFARQVTGSGGWNLAERGVALQDIDNDGLADLARYELGNRAWRKNSGGVLGPERPLTGAAEVDLESVRMLDLDSDLTPEMIYVVDDSWRVYRMDVESVDGEATSAACSQRAHRWVGGDSWPGTAGVPLHDPNVVFADLDDDTHTDVIQAVTDGISIRWGSVAGLSAPERRPLLSTSDSFLEPGDNDVQLLDMQGDGLVDAVWLADNWIKVYPGRGDGTFETREVRYCYPWNWSGDLAHGPTLADPDGHCALRGGDVVDFADLRLVDLDRDGMLDLVRVSAGQVYWYPGYWFAEAEDGSLPFGSPTRLPRPDGALYDDIVTFADFNGNGSEDVVWSSQSGLWFLDMAASPATRSMMTAVRNGLGTTTRITYTTTTLSQLAACDDEPWKEPYPSTMVVPFQISTEVEDAPTQRMTYLVRDAFWDESEQRFGGFLESIEVEDASPFDSLDANDLVTRTSYERGTGANRVLRGTPFRVERADGNGSIFDETVTSLQTISVAGMACDDPLLRVAVVTDQFTTISERTCDPKFLRQEFAHDEYGNTVRMTNFGEVGETGADLPDAFDHADETESLSDFVSDWDRWILFKPCQERLRAVGADELTSRSVTVYDSSAIVPTSGCVGGVGDGRPRATYAWLDTDDRWIRESKLTYDTLGNLVESEIQGVVRRITWSDDGVHPRIEEILDDGAPTSLTWEVTAWDSTLGAALEVTDSLGRRKRVVFDGMGRPLSTWAASGGAEIKLASFAYVLAGPGPVPRIESVVHEEDGTIPELETVKVLDGRGRERYVATREDAGWLISGHRQNDARGRVARVAMPYHYPGSALPPASFPTSAQTETIMYDALGRTVQQALPAVPRHGLDQSAATRSVVYEPFRQTTSASDLSDVIVTNDGLGRMISTARMVDWLEEVRAEWDARGRLTRWTVNPTLAGGAGSVVHEFEYDSLDRLTRALDPEAGERFHAWDDSGRLLSTTNAVGDIISYGYDFAGRLATREGSSAHANETWSFIYDEWHDTSGDGADRPSSLAPGELVAVVGPDDDIAEPGRRLYYDAFDRVVAEDRRIVGADGVTEFSSGYTYSRSGRMLEHVAGLPDRQIKVVYDYDRVGRVNWIGAAFDESPVSMLWQASQLTAAGGSLEEHLGNGFQTTLTRDALDRIASVTTTDPTTDEVVYGTEISRNAYGAPSRVVDLAEYAPGSPALSRSTALEYDGAGRLTSSKLAWGTPQERAFEYDYDALQNLRRREQVSSSAVPSTILSGTYAYGASGASPRQMTSGDDVSSLTYDQAGRVSSIVDGTGTTSMWYDAFDRLRHVEEPGGLTTSHAYGDSGARTYSAWPSGGFEKCFDDALCYRDPDGAGPIDGKLELDIGLGDRRVVATLQSSVGGSDVTYMIQGLDAGPVVISSSSKTEQRFFEPYGAELGATEGLSFAPLFDDWSSARGGAGKRVAPTNRWSDHGARWFSSRSASWLTVDPELRTPDALLAAGLDASPYGYASSNPLLFWDVDGREPVPQDAGRVGFTAREMRVFLVSQTDYDRYKGTNCIASARMTVAAIVGALPRGVGLHGDDGVWKSLQNGGFGVTPRPDLPIAMNEHGKARSASSFLVENHRLFFQNNLPDLQKEMEAQGYAKPGELIPASKIRARRVFDDPVRRLDRGQVLLLQVTYLSSDGPIAHYLVVFRDADTKKIMAADPVAHFSRGQPTVYDLDLGLIGKPQPAAPHIVIGGSAATGNPVWLSVEVVK